MQKKTILIIDDDVCIGDMLQELLEKNNYAVARAYSGTEALYAIQNNRPDLILLNFCSQDSRASNFCRKFKTYP